MTSGFACLALLLAGAAACAEVWGCVGARGAARFAAGTVDERHERFCRGGEGFDTGAGLPEGLAFDPLPERA